MNTSFKVVIVVFPDHTHFLFLTIMITCIWKITLLEVRSIILISFEAGPPSLVCGCILGLRSPAYYFQVTVT